MDNSTTPTVPPAAADPGPEPGEQPAVVDLHTLVDSLTPAQRSGRACITCGATGTRLKPLGHLLTFEVAECDTHQWRRSDASSPASWLTGCPQWCTDARSTDGFAMHRGADCHEDRHHVGTYLSVELHTMDYVDVGAPNAPVWQPREVMVNLVQHYREAEPRVCLSGGGDADTAFYLSLGEARKLRTHLDELLADADGDLPKAAAGTSQAAQTARGVLAGVHADNVRRGEVKPPPPQCEVWCTDHRTEVSHPEDSYCRRPAERVEGMFLTATDDGPMLFQSVLRDEFTLEQFEEYARAGLELVAAGRKGGAL